jgi:hypothetical protein
MLGEATEAYDGAAKLLLPVCPRWCVFVCGWGGGWVGGWVSMGWILAAAVASQLLLLLQVCLMEDSPPPVWHDNAHALFLVLLH